MKKLWEKDYNTDKLLESFTVGQDRELDLALAEYDAKASKAHAKMLAKIGLLTDEESKLLVEGLDSIIKTIQDGHFVIEKGVEDVHSQIEMILTQKYGDIGKKIHSGRSRNDQVLTAIKLLAKYELKSIAHLVRELFYLLQSLSEKYKDILIPGYTHMQVAMPSSFGLWFGAYAESLADDLLILKAASQIVDKNPLGSAAGYGSSFPLDREFTTEEIGFAGLNYNVVYAQMTRGKTEKTTAMALSVIASTVSKLAMDVCMYNGQNFGFLSLPDEFTTGSSIMPHKKNPDGFELVRAKCNKLQALPMETTLILNNLPSGYHRDLQITKESFIPAFNTMKDCLKMTISMLKNISVKEGIAEEEKYKDMFSVELVNQLVLEGMPFRDAYQEVGKRAKKDDFQLSKNINHQHIGSIGNLANEEIRKTFDKTFDYYLSSHDEEH
ncbi:MAG: argininosuccinate lyase [Cyclobacteriaceae bacterium]